LKPELEAVGLVTLLFIVTFALGIEFGGSGFAGASGGFGPPPTSGGGKQIAILPRLVLRAEGVNSSDLYVSGSYRAIPANMKVPLVGLHANLVLPERNFPSYFSRLPSFSLTTNSSGLASGLFPAGDYEVEISGSNFALGTIITLADNTTATLNFTLSPSADAVSVLKVVSQDSVTGLEPTSIIYALLNYTSAPSEGFSELVGFESFSGMSPTSGGAINPNTTNPSPITPISLNATLLGYYRGIHGYWATLSPLGSNPDYPSVGVMLFQYTPILEVNYTAG
jgi:hypothetical protein